MYFLVYKGEQLPFAVDFAVIKNVCSKLQIKLSAFESTIDNPEQTEVIAFEGLKRGHRLEGKEFKISAGEIEDILSENYGLFLRAFTDSVLKMFQIPDNEANKKK